MASTRAAVTSPPRARIDAVINANTRSESVCPRYQIGSTQFTQPLVENVETFQYAVVREDSAVLQERMGVDHVVRSGGRVADMRDERGAGQVVGFGGELDVVPRRNRLLVHLRTTLVVEDAQPAAVRVSSALLGKVVGSVQQPKRRGDNIRPGVQPEKSAHVQPVSSADSVSNAWRA